MESVVIDRKVVPSCFKNLSRGVLERTDAQVALSRAQAEVVTARYNLLDTRILITRLIGE